MNRLFTNIAILVLALLLAAPAMAATIDLKLEPRDIQIGTFYDGGTVHVEGSIPEGAEVVLRFAGQPQELRMKKKGKALGLLWMNLGSLTFDNTPNVFLVSSSKPLEEMSGEAANLGLEGLTKSIEVTPAEADEDAMLHELLKLKKSEKLYAERTGEIVMGQTTDGVTAFTADLRVPSRLAPGKYELSAYALKDGAIVAQGGDAVTAELVALPRFISDMAFGHSALFGVLAAIAAILGGLVIGWIFQGSAKGAH